MNREHRNIVAEAEDILQKFSGVHTTDQLTQDMPINDRQVWEKLVQQRNKRIEDSAERMFDALQKFYSRRSDFVQVTLGEPKEPVEYIIPFEEINSHQLALQHVRDKEATYEHRLHQLTPSSQ
jgi:hypothetical protein